MASRRALLVLSVALPPLLCGLTPAPQPPATLGAQDPGQDQPLGRGPAWRGPVRPTAANEVFATGDGCAMCHSLGARAVAMRSPTGDDVSPHGLWRATMMANSFRDPHWRAQVAKESAANPEHAEDVQALCLRCHAPMAHHTAKLGGQPAPSIATAVDDPLAEDGVSCTVCHQIQADGLGTAATFSGQGKIARGRHIFGPFADPAPGPMRMHSGFVPTHGEHMRDSGHCGSCHTLFTGHAGKEFPEQTPYLEWRNSVFAAPGDDGRTCQECHMPDQGAVRIARNPGGRDFNIPARDGYRAHTFVGGNAFMIDMLAEHRDELGVKAPVAALRRMADATRHLLSDATANLHIEGAERDGDRMRFNLRVENLTGHKLPTGYPSRRAWLEVQVRAGQRVVFHSGAVDEGGRLVGIDNELTLPHRDRVDDAGQVVVYEMIAHDEQGAPTTHLTRMATRAKDTRLLPRGWRADGPWAESTSPMGIGDDADFADGGDTVHFDVPLGEGVEGRLVVVAWLRYQTVPPAWVDALRPVDADEARTFVKLYDGTTKTPETLALDVAFVD